MKAAPVQEKKVLVTGCSTGIGRATARVLKEAGWEVAPTARKDADLESLRDEGFNPVRLDLTDSESVVEAAGDVLERFGGVLGGLVNNAGFGQPGAMEDLDRDMMRSQFEVNLFGMQELTNRCIPVWREQGWGRLVNISSVVGRIALPFFGIYSASKFAMEAVSDAMRVELHGTGIGISLVEPGPIESAFRDRAVKEAKVSLDFSDSRHGRLYTEEMEEREMVKADQRLFMLPPESVGEKVRHALESARPRTRYKVTLPTYFGAFMRRFAPDGVIDTVLRERMKRKKND